MESAPADEWLTVSLERNGGLLLEHGLFKSLLNQLSPLDQFPSLISVFGASCNAPLVNALQGGMPQEPGPGIFVKLDTNTLRSEVPRFYANCFLDHCLLPADERIRSDCRRHPLSWYRNHVPAEEVVDRVYSNLVVPFSDVLCFLSNSLSNAIADARKYLRWIDHIQPRPRAIFIFTDILNSSSDDFRPRAERIRHTLGPELGASTVITCLPEPNLCRRRPVIVAQSLAAFRALLSHQVRLAQAARDRASMHFNTAHFSALFGLACQHLSVTIRPFDFIQASRIGRPVPTAIKTHITRFLQEATGHQDLIKFVAPVIASALMMDSCPPGMHRTDRLSHLRNHSRPILT